MPGRLSGTSGDTDEGGAVCHDSCWADGVLLTYAKEKSSGILENSVLFTPCKLNEIGDRKRQKKKKSRSKEQRKDPLRDHLGRPINRLHIIVPPLSSLPAGVILLGHRAWTGDDVAPGSFSFS